MVTDDLFNWEISNTISANRKFDTFAIISTPVQMGQNESSTYMVNGPSYKLTQKKGHYDVPIFLKLAEGHIATHGRNAVVKNELFYDVVAKG
jgi:hypothetical protein